MSTSSSAVSTPPDGRRRSILPQSSSSRRTSLMSPSSLRLPRTPPPPAPIIPTEPSAPHTSMDLEDPTLSYSSRQQSTQSAPPLDSHPTLTLADLDAPHAPSSYTGGAGRHVKDEIEELLYQLQVKEKEIRWSRGAVESEISAMKRSVKKLQRDTDDLVRMQHANMKTIANTR